MAISEIKLFGTTLEELKSELEKHLARAMQRQVSKPAAMPSAKIPMGFSGFIQPGESFEAITVFPLAGKLSCFSSFVSGTNKDVVAQITLYRDGGSNRIDQKLLDGFRSYDTAVEVPANSFAKIKLVNNGKVEVQSTIGFVFQEGTYEI